MPVVLGKRGRSNCSFRKAISCISSFVCSLRSRATSAPPTIPSHHTGAIPCSIHHLPIHPPPLLVSRPHLHAPHRVLHFMLSKGLSPEPPTPASRPRSAVTSCSIPQRSSLILKDQAHHQAQSSGCHARQEPVVSCLLNRPQPLQPLFHPPHQELPVAARAPLKSHLHTSWLAAYTEVLSRVSANPAAAHQAHQAWPASEQVPTCAVQ